MSSQAAPSPSSERAFDEETSPIDALIAFSKVLDKLGEPDGRETGLQVLWQEMRLFLHDYRRTLEWVGAQIMALPSLQEREIALSAYQNVCRRVALRLSVVENILKDLT
jgi:hypothetical protein